ncbi:ATP-dependent protease [Halopseudomonas oceani]|uniref:ATP-dependent protease n=2 Tax=Halopseudomonas oceani TaxID=1708783 RepID=A0A2P4EXR9_9GAMM|nr:ATP-dependent protease [Halopseudomonas oceani]
MIRPPVCRLCRAAVNDKGISVSEQIALFPLKTVLMPGCHLDLQIFEARYLDMVSRCFRQQQGFVVVGLEQGSEVGTSNLRFSAIGCEARIIDWQQRDNGLLGIRVEGHRRARLGKVDVAADGLVTAEAQWLPEALDAPLEAEHDELLALHAALQEHPLVSNLQLPPVDGSQQALAWQLAYLLPLSLEQKTSLLALTPPLERLDRIGDWLVQMQA